MIARMLGWTPRPVAAAGPPRVEEIAAAAPPGFAVLHGAGLGMPAPLDENALRAKNQATALAAARRNHRAIT